MEDEDDWRQCAEWLNRCQILPNDHPALGPDGNALNLVQALMDGVALCHVISTLSNNEIDIRSMKDFSPNPQNSQFLCCQNIRLFTQLCEKEFGIPRAFLIQPNDIYQAKNFGKAIALLSKLSLSPRAQSSGIAGFPPENSKLQITHEYYNNLEEIAASLDKLHGQVTATNYAQMEEETKEKLYDTVVHQGAKGRYNISSESTTARSSCIREIVDTEKNYVDLLKMLLEKYKIPLTGVLSNEELDEILKYIEELHIIHRELLSNLSLATSPNMNFITLSEVFLQARDHLLIYGEYCGHVQRAQSLVLDIMRNDVDKRTRIESCQLHSEKYNKFHLTELLTVPIQRVLKYHLLLEQLCKLTPADHPERAELSQAHEAMKELAQTVNEVKRDLDTISAIDQIQASLLEITLPADKKLSSYGRRHMDGEVKVLSQAEAKAKIRYLFLFDKTLLICKPKGDSFTFMIAYHIINTPFHAVQLPTKKGEKYSSGFTLPIGGDGNSPDLTFFAKSAELREAWLKAAKAAISNLYPPGAKDKGYNFELFTFKRPTYCCVCNKLLQGIFYQGYRCRETGYAAHKACLVSNNLPVRYPSAAHLNGMTPVGPQPPPLPPQSATLRSRRSQLPPPNLPSTALSTPVRVSSSASTLSSLVSQPDSFEFSHMSDAISSLNRWTTTDASSMNSQRFRRVSSGVSSCHITVTARRAYFGEPVPPTGGPPLTLAAGDQVELLNWAEDAVWWKGRHMGTEGWFPAPVVDVPMSRQQRATTIEIGPSTRQSSQLFPMSSPSLIGSSSGSLVALAHRHSLPLECCDPVNGNRTDCCPKESWVTFDPDQMCPRPDGGTCSTPRPGDTSDSLSAYDWYVGEMDRAEAVALLNSCENGTFLVRVSKSAERLGEYSLSLVYGFPRHIRIQRTISPDGSSVTYGLCELEQFPNIPAMIEHYSKVSLNRCFDEVNTALLYPYQPCPTAPLFYVRANFDFSSDSRARLLNLKQNDRVAVLSRSAENRGWWKGWLNGRIGFFPMSYVVREVAPV
ncbi:unnamed protein product [Calicophoron daubneyi]|uniref:Guanine nucleotide exchange factor VAV2 n=1 Tax=Calicophoron daubneyi TaxID=300641 RepID=A0AAV2T4L1_CALDB